MVNQPHSPTGEFRPNKYQTRQRVREDELGEVVRAIQTDTGSEVALLQLRRQFYRAPVETMQRLRMAAAEAKTLNHPSVVQVVDFQLDHRGGDLFIAMTFIDGETLRTWLASRSAGVSLSTAAKIVADLADAFHHIGENGRRWVHPVVNPDKIIITQKQIGRTDHPVMVDLGFVHLFSIYGGIASEPTTRDQEDVHALGVLFFDLLSGGFPSDYGKADLRFAEQRQVEQGINELTLRLHIAPSTLWTTLRRALAVDPTQRFASPAEFGR
ncbi:MAG: protein kinase, partial [Caldilinea sp.]